MATPKSTSSTPEDLYEKLRAQGSRALYEGRLLDAADHFDEAHRVAVDSGDQRLVDLAYCNRAAIAIRLQRGEKVTPRLQEILLRTTDPLVARMSSYYLAVEYDRPEGHRKSLFYARISLRYAKELGDPELQASSINKIGNIFCAMNEFEEALNHFRQAEKLLQKTESPSRAVVWDNIGYCKTVLGDYREGFEYLFRSLRMLRRSGARLYETEPRLALCFAYLHIGRPGRAVRHGAEALDLAEEAADAKLLKYALLLLGEAYKMAGETEVAQECFTLLQETFYPEMPEVPQMLFGLDVCKMINLRA